MRGGAQKPDPRPIWVPPAACRGSKSAFTLVEMMIVVAIVVVLMAIVVPSYRAMANQSRRTTCAANLKSIGQALAIFREDYQCYPPDGKEFLALPSDANRVDGDPANLLQTAATDAQGNPINTGVRGLGLFTLFYLGVYASSLPPASSEPRIGSDLRKQLDRQGKGLNGLLWFRGAGYITRLETFHCPANEKGLEQDDLRLRQRLPSLGGWNNYDMYYRRNFWYQGTSYVPPGEGRHLLQAYPPADTAVTWCPYHRTSRPPPEPGMRGEVYGGDQDLVLFADGTVRRMASQPNNRMFEEPAAGAGWPEGPIM
jgi:prepilin-type N-terminal cleavage/methylation domain-containing protein